MKTKNKKDQNEIEMQLEVAEYNAMHLHGALEEYWNKLAEELRKELSCI